MQIIRTKSISLVVAGLVAGAALVAAWSAWAGGVDSNNRVEVATFKTILKPTSIINAGNMASATLTSTNADLTYVDNVSVQVTWTGTAVGNLQVLTSNDGTNWVVEVDVPAAGGSTTGYSGLAINGVAGTFRLDLNQVSAPLLRAVYTKVSSTGSLTVSASGKGI